MKKLIIPTAILNGTTKFHGVNSPRSHLVLEQTQDPKNGIKPLSKLATERQEQGVHGVQNHRTPNVHEDSNTGTMPQLSAGIEFQKRSIVNNTSSIISSGLNISLILNFNIIIFLAIFFTTSTAFAIRESRPTPVDSRIRVMVYNPDDVFKFTGYYGYQASIELASNEEVISISMGDTTSWQIVPAGHRIFIKPMEPDATTNLTLITNKRTYFFELYAEETTDIRDPGMVFNVKFIYPDEEDEDHIRTFSKSDSKGPDLKHPENFNFYYSISGNEEIAPIKIFDDGEFTYLQFRDKNNEIPAIFAVDEDLMESMVNFRLDPNNSNLVVVEQVFKKLTLRAGKKIVCVFNETYKPY